jgi:hypothetical protein
MKSQRWVRAMAQGSAQASGQEQVPALVRGRELVLVQVQVLERVWVREQA